MSQTTPTSGRVRDGWGRIIAVVSVAGGLAPFPAHSRHLAGVLALALVFAVYAVAWNLLFGMSGQLLLCVGALAGVAAYGCAILADDRGWPLGLAVAVGIVAAAGAGAGLAWLAVVRRLGVLLVGVVTLVASLAFANVLLAARAHTGGETGRVVGTASATVLAHPVGAHLALTVVLAVALIVYRLVAISRLGTAARAVRDDPVAAALAGVDVVRTNVAVAALAAALIGLAGALHGLQEGFVSPGTFAFGHVDVRVLVIVMIGGLGTTLGPVVGAAAVTILDELLRPLGQLRLVVYGAVLLVAFLGVRDAVAVRIAAWTRSARRR